jgi:hypothetical protein
MEKQFIPYEQALALKELGFDLPCLFDYNRWNTERLNDSYFNYVNYNVREGSVSAPLYQQAFRWFREKHNLKGHIEAVEYLDETPDTYHWCVFDKFNSGYDQLTYEEAELECLKKLIEIVKRK